MKYLFFLSTLLLAGSAQARIGETPGQCVDRYGPALAVDPTSQKCSFLLGGIRITCHFLNGKAAKISYSKPDSIGIRQPLTSAEIAAFLKANSFQEWTPEPASDGNPPTWTSGSTTAVYNTDTNTLIVLTQLYVEHYQAKEDQRLSKF
jgi:hypothetical protein